MAKVTAATSPPVFTQNLALFMLLLNRSTVTSGYSRVNRMEAWSMMDTRERESSLMANTTAALLTGAFTPCWSTRELSTPLSWGWGALHKNQPLTAPLKPTRSQAHRLKWLLSLGIKTNSSRTVFLLLPFPAHSRIPPTNSECTQLARHFPGGSCRLPPVSPGTGKGCQQTGAACRFVLTPGYNFLKVRQDLFLSKVTAGSTRKQIQWQKLNCSSLSFSSDACTCIQTGSGSWHYITKSGW